MNDTIIKVEGIGKKYRIHHKRPERYSALRDVIADKVLNAFRPKRPRVGEPAAVEDFWALKDVSFEVKRGEVVGIIGRNGAGKSTLLKILSRITEPTQGRIEIDGRIASLLEVGTGFHPELTGRENIYLNGAILGMSRLEIKRKFDEIVAFAEIEKFLDTPVKRYSSGMYVRLAFSVAAHMEPEILIVDEVLAVGDAEFQKKCLGKMESVAKGEGRTVLFVSHNMGAVKALTQRCFYLESGRIAGSGLTPKVVEEYLLGTTEKNNNANYDINLYRQPHTNESLAEIRRISIAGAKRSTDSMPTMDINSNFTIEVELDVSRSLRDVHVTIFLKNSKGESVAIILSLDNDSVFSFGPGLHKISAQIKEMPLAPEQYFADVHISKLNEASYDIISDFPLFHVINSGQVVVWPERSWGVLHCSSVRWEVNARANTETESSIIASEALYPN